MILKMGNGTESQVLGTYVADLHIQGFRETLRFIVTPLDSEFDVILGQHYLRRRGCHMDLENNCMTLRKGNVTHKLYNVASSGCVNASYADGVA